MNPEIANPPTTSTDTSPSTKPPISGVKKLLRNRRAMTIVGVVAFVIVALMGYSVWQQSQNTATDMSRPWNNSPIFPPNSVVATVGAENIYGDDLNYILETNYPDATESAAVLKDEALELAAVESAILQQAQQDGLVSLKAELFNAVYKDQSAREDELRKVRQQVREKSDKFTTSAVSVWFYNVDPPTVSVAQAEQIARTKLTQIYGQLQNSSLTMVQAGEAIKKDAKLARVDRNYDGNAYTISADWDRDNPAFTFNELTDAVYNLKEGQMTPVTKVSDVRPNHREEFFVIIKMEKRFDGQFRSLGEWTRMAETAYSLKQL